MGHPPAPRLHDYGGGGGTTKWNEGKFPEMGRLAGINFMLKGLKRCFIISSTLSNSQRKTCPYRKKVRL